MNSRLPRTLRSTAAQSAGAPQVPSFVMNKNDTVSLSSYLPVFSSIGASGPSQGAGNASRLLSRRLLFEVREAAVLDPPDLHAQGLEGVKPLLAAGRLDLDRDQVDALRLGPGQQLLGRLMPEDVLTESGGGFGSRPVSKSWKASAGCSSKEGVQPSSEPLSTTTLGPHGNPDRRG